MSQTKRPDKKVATEEVVLINKDVSQPHNRFILLGGTDLDNDIGTAVFAEDEKVKSIRFKLTGGVAGNRARVVFDATPVDVVDGVPDTTQAKAWLTEVIAAAFMDTDIEYFEITQGGANGADEWSEWFPFGEALRRCDGIAVDADTPHKLFFEVA